MASRPVALGSPRPPSPSLAGWVVALYLVVRGVILLAPLAAVFVLTTALVGGWLEEPWQRWLVGAIAALGLPLALEARVAAALKNRGRPRRHSRLGAPHLAPLGSPHETRAGSPSLGWFIPAVNIACALALAFGFADDVGRALRRRGDWFVGDRNGIVARHYRAGVGALAMYLEKFDPPMELRPTFLPPDPKRVPLGPWRPGEVPPEAQPTEVAWFHPLAGPTRAMPITESRRFGAARPQPRPPECELGHCGVDLGTTAGEPVFAIYEGVIERIERDESEGGRAGRYVRIGHKDGTVVSRYIHLDSIRDDLKPGVHVAGGELIGRLGRTGVINSGAHLHFALSMRPDGPSGKEHYIDPEPMLRRWQLPDARTLVAAR